MARKITNWLKGYMEYTKHLEAPDSFHLWSGVGTIAGALRGKTWFDMGYFKWKPNFFIILVAPPGVVSKSTTMGVGMDMLREIDGIHFGPDSATWQALTEAFAAATEFYEYDDLKHTMSAITIAASELGTFLDPRNREMIDVLVDLWDGRTVPWKRTTKSSGESIIPNPWLNFMGCTTPAWIEGNFPEYAIGGGFTSRTVFVYAETKRHFEAYPKKQLNQDFQDLRTWLVEDLKEIASLTGQFTLTKDAERWGTKWYEDHWLAKHAHLSGERFGGYIARKQTHIHKLAMVISAAQRDTLLIEEEDLSAANDLVSSLEENLPSVFQRISDNRDVKYMATLIQTMRRLHYVSKQNLWREMYHLMSWEQFDLALNGAVRAGLLSLHGTETDTMVRLRGKPTPSQGTSDGRSLLSESHD